MKKLFLLLSSGSFLVGTAVVTLDLSFINSYHADFNDVAGTDGPWIIEWPTGERPVYANFPLWFYGVVLCFLAFGFAMANRFRRKQYRPSIDMRGCE
jgi:hypothetical protein